MDGLTPVYEWLQPIDNSMNAFDVPQMIDWFDGTDPWPAFGMPAEFGVSDDLQLSHVPGNVFCPNRSRECMEIDGIEARPAPQPPIQHIVEPSQLQVATNPQDAADDRSLDANRNDQPHANDRVSDWLAKTRPEVHCQRGDQQDGCSRKCSTEVAALKSEVAQLQKCFRDACSSFDAIERREARMAKMQEQIETLTKWSAEVSVTFNDFQLKELGMSPLQKHFGLVLGPRLKKRSRVS